MTATPARPTSSPESRRIVLIVHASDEAYGSDRIVLALVDGLRDRELGVLVLLPDDGPPGWLSGELVSRGVAVRRVGLAIARRRYLRPRAVPAYLRLLWRARREIRREAIRGGATVIHINTSAVLAGAVVGRPGGARVVWHVHEIIAAPRSLAWLLRSLPPLTSDRVIVISDAVRRNLFAPGPLARRITTIHNGLVSSLQPTSRLASHIDDAVVAFVGRLNSWKGQEVFVDAVAELAPRYPRARFIIAGDAPPGEPEPAAALERQVLALGLENRIERVGRVPDGAAVFREADVAVLASTLPEPFGMVLLEAMDAGCAVVATAHGGVLEIVEDGVTGLLVPPRDASALAAAIERLILDPDLRRRLGEAAHARVITDFSLDDMIDRVVGVYREAGA